MNQTNERRLERHQLRRAYQDSYDAVLAILFRHDPVGICTQDNPNRETEYANEVDTILPRLKGAASEQQVHQIVYEEFVVWFDASAGATRDYDLIARDIWRLLQELELPAV